MMQFFKFASEFVYEWPWNSHMWIRSLRRSLTQPIKWKTKNQKPTNWTTDNSHQHHRQVLSLLYISFPIHCLHFLIFTKFEPYLHIPMERTKEKIALQYRSSEDKSTTNFSNKHRPHPTMRRTCLCQRRPAKASANALVISRNHLKPRKPRSIQKRR